MLTFAQAAAVETLEAAGALEGVEIAVEDAATMEQRLAAETPFNVIEPRPVGADDPAYALAAHFVSTLFPVGHIKSTRLGDETFVNFFSDSDKWLHVTSM